MEWKNEMKCTIGFDNYNAMDDHGTKEGLALLSRNRSMQL